MIAVTVTLPGLHALPRHWWTCDGCGTKLAEIRADGTLVIAPRRDRPYVLRLPEDGAYTRCKCGRDNRITPAEVAVA